MKSEEIMQRLNAITKAEFETNWNLGEIARTVKNDIKKESSYNVLAKELKEELNKDIDNEHVIEVSGLGFIAIYKKEFVGDIETYKLEKTIFSENSKLLPYTYTMGKKVSKSIYESTMKILK